MRDGEGVEVLRARLAAPFAQVGAVLAPRALAADDVPEDGREAVAQLLLEARAGPEQVEVLRIGEPVRLARGLRREAVLPLEPGVERHQEAVADVGVGLAEVHVHRVRRDVARDLHERGRVHRAAAGQDEPAGGLEPRLGVQRAEGVRALDALRLAAGDAPRAHDGRAVLRRRERGAREEDDDRRQATEGTDRCVHRKGLHGLCRGPAAGPDPIAPTRRRRTRCYHLARAAGRDGPPKKR